MSALLSIYVFLSFSVDYGENQALQIGGFRNIQQNWMVFSLSSDFHKTQGAVGIPSGFCEHFEEKGLADVERAGASNQDSAGAKHLERAQVELFVAAERGVQVAL